MKHRILFHACLLLCLGLSACSSTPQVVTPTATRAVPLAQPTWAAIAAATQDYTANQPTAAPPQVVTATTVPSATPTLTLVPLPSATLRLTPTLLPSVNANPDTFDYTTLPELSGVMLSARDVLADNSPEATITIFYREPPATPVESTSEMAAICRYHKDCAKKTWFAGLRVRTTIMLIRAPSVALAVRAAQAAATDYSKTSRKMTWWLGGEQDTAIFTPLLSEHGLPPETWLLAKDETHYFIATHRGTVAIIIFDEFEAKPDLKINMDDHARALLLLAGLQSARLEKAGFPK